MRTAYSLATPDPQPPIRSSRRYSKYAIPLLTFFARHRTALALHVQRQFPDVFHTDRATRMHLQTLVAHRDLAIVRQPRLGQPNAYQLTQTGVRSFRERTATSILDTERSRRRTPTGSHLLHELLITEFAVSLAEAVRARPDLHIPWEERFGFVHEPVFKTLIPDYGFLLKHPQGLLISFVEVFSGEASKTRIGQKLQSYAQWSVDPATQEFLTTLYRQQGAQEPRPQFRLLVIVHDRRTRNDRRWLHEILRETIVLPRTMRQRIWGTTLSDLARAQNIDTPVWVRARDLQLPDSDGAILTRREQRHQLAAALRSLPQHRLFPSLEASTHVPPSNNPPDRLDDPDQREQSQSARGISGP